MTQQLADSWHPPSNTRHDTSCWANLADAASSHWDLAAQNLAQA